MQADLTTFRLLFPEFATVSDDRIQLYLTQETDELLPAVWGRCFGKAVLYRVAHLLALSMQREAQATIIAGGSVAIAPTGTIASASAGGLSVAFATSPASAGWEWWNQTPYGQAYQVITRQCLGGSELSW